MTVSVGIVAHTSRIEQAEHLAELVATDYMSVDDGTLGVEGNHRKVWSKLSESTEPWVCVLEDDAVPVDGFREQLEQILAIAPTPIVGLYLGHPSHWATHHPRLETRLHQARHEADQQDACFITTLDLIHGVGIAIQTPLVSSMLKYQSDLPFDYHIRGWARINQHHIGLTWPSIIDHADGPTLVNHRDGIQRSERKAWRVDTRTEWTAKSVPL